MNPNVKSFLCGKTSIVEAAITSILSFASHNKSAHSTNQADLFDYIHQREGQVKHIAMCYEYSYKIGLLGCIHPSITTISSHAIN